MAGCLPLLLLAGPAWALGPEDVFVVGNKNVPESKLLVEHYCAKRGVPKENVLLLDLPAGEEISRRDYDTRLAAPLRSALAERKEKVKVLLTVYGVPLRVGRVEPGADQKVELEKVRKELGGARQQLRALEKQIEAIEREMRDKATEGLADRLAAARKERDAAAPRLRRLEQSERLLANAETEACVDSELSLLWWEKYELRRWVPNPLNFQMPDKLRKSKPPVIMTARLDGPTVEIVKGLVDRAVEVEKKGLDGKVYVDARGVRYKPSASDPGYGYAGYDESLREMARLLETEGKMTVVLDDRSALFAPQTCPDCALYCGWYSLAQFVDCCRFRPGAVAYHIASSEAVSLRRKEARYWCKNLLERGVIVTLGPVAEPYTIGFPKPAEFFALLATGKYPVVECYHRTLLLTSWMMVLVGDPLYNPFGKTPRLGEDHVRPSPAGGTFLFR
jgi:uncharacterized protein (TIGR03790 family)